MYLIVSATELEICQIRQNIGSAEIDNFSFLVTGTGMVESAISLTRFLSEEKEKAGHQQLNGIILFGISGAYLDTGTQLLDFCLAEAEHFGDFGVATNNKIEYFDNDISNQTSDYDLRNPLFASIEEILNNLQVPYRVGHFVTVNSCTGTRVRGDFLQQRYNAICENMEGAALARVCTLFQKPFAEVRCISNLVEDRDKSKWKIEEAARKGGRIVVKILAELTKRGR